MNKLKSCIDTLGLKSLECFSLFGVDIGISFLKLHVAVK